MDIEMQQVRKLFRGDVCALDAVDLHVPGGIFGLLGPNGAGKTTLMRILAGVLRPTSGAYRVGDVVGTSERGRRAIQRMLGYLPQEFGVYPDLRACFAKVHHDVTSHAFLHERDVPE